MEKQITFRLPPAWVEPLRRASNRLQRRNSDVVRLALRAFPRA